MRVTVLGKSPSWQDAGGACSGYLVQSEDTTVLMDCGNGVFAKMRERIDYVDLDGIVISHLHADHILELVPYASGQRYGPRKRASPPRLIAPPGAPEAFAGMSEATRMTAEHIELAFDVSIYDPSDTVALGELRVRFQPVPHFIPTNAVELAGDGARLTYSADCGPNDELCAFAAGTDLLLIEATLPVPDMGHLTAEQAGAHGARAGAKRVVLTHFSDELDVEWARAEGERGFGAPVDAAHEGAVYDLGA